MVVASWKEPMPGVLMTITITISIQKHFFLVCPNTIPCKDKQSAVQHVENEEHFEI